MMKKNYFGKAMAVVAMVLAGLSITSCDEKDNAIIINGKEWVKAEVTKTDDGATIVANTPSDVNRLLMKVASDINDALQAGDDYVITIDAPALEASEGDNTISLPLYDYLTADPTSEAKVVVNFANAFSTDVPLLIQAKGSPDTYYGPAAKNKVELNIPAGASGIDLVLKMSESSVTLNAEAGAVTIDELTASTAYNTLNIESGVTVNWLTLKNGYAVVKEGGKVLGYAADNFDVFIKGIKKDVFKNKVPSTLPAAEDDDYYWIQKGKLIKADDNISDITIHGSYEGKAKEVTEIIIPDGIKAWVNTNNNNIMPIVNVTGEGDAAIMTKGYIDSNNENKVSPWYTTANLTGINKLDNVTVDMTNVLLWNAETQAYDTPTAMDESFSNDISLPAISENCTFIAKTQINGSVKDGVLSKVTDCTLATPYKSSGGGGSISHVEAVNSKLTGTFMNYISGNSENSTFTCNWIDFNNDRYSGNTATVKNCKFESSTENSSLVRVGVPFQTESRNSFSMNFENCSFPKSFMFRTWVDANKPVYDDKGVETGTEPAYYNDYQIKMAFTGSTIDGKAITKDNFVIGIISDGFDENNEVATTTRIIIDGVSYKAIKDPDTQKWSLIAAE